MKLTIQSGAESGQTFEFTQDLIVIGRGTHGDIVLSDPAVSRHHCQIRREAEGYVIQDMGSVNGTFVNNELITAPCRLCDGDLITVGETVLAVQESGVTPAAEPSPRVAAEAPVGRELSAQPWALIGGGILALIIIGWVLAAVFSGPPAPTPAPRIFPTSSPTLAVVAPTATVAATTAPVSPPSPSPTAVWSPAPQLLQPKERSSFAAEDAITLSWTWFRQLGSDEYFQLQLSRESAVQDWACTTYSTYTLPAAPLGFGTYSWRVVVRKGTVGKQVCSFEGEVSLPSETWTFEWKPPEVPATPTTAPSPTP